MDTKTAISNLGRLKHLFRDFEHLEEVLKKFDQMERILGQFEGKKITLSQEVEAIGDKLKIAKAELDKFEDNAKAKRRGLVQGSKNEKDRLNHQVKELRSATTIQINAFTLELEEARTNHDKLMKEMKAEEARVTKSIESLNRQYKQFQDKMESAFEVG